MNWFRAYHGMPSDTKLGLVAQRAGVKRGHALAVWLCALDYASSRPDDDQRGVVAGLDVEQVAYILEFDPDEVGAILDGFRTKGMISPDGILTAWEKRNPRREREDPSAERTREWRKRKRNGVTPGDATVTPGDATTNRETPGDPQEQSRAEQSREDQSIATTSSSSACLPTTTSAAVAPLLGARLGTAIFDDDQAVRNLVRKVLEVEPTARPDEIADLTYRTYAAVAGSNTIVNLTGYLIKHVPEHFRGEPFRRYRERRKPAGAEAGQDRERQVG